MPPRIELKTLPPEEAIAYFRQKGFKIGFDHRDVWQQEHQAAFTVAKAMQLDLLADIRAQVDAALTDGTTFETFKANLKPNLVRRGWWGRAMMTDPADGQIKEVQLGSTRRLKVIYDTNLRTAHSEGQWERIQASKAAFPWLRYSHTPSKNERKEHAGWHGLVLPVDDPWWQSHMPVKAWGCKCRAVPMSASQVERRGLKVGQAPAERYYDYTNKRTGEMQRVPAGVDPGFNYPPGGRLANLGKMLAEKAERAPAALGAAAFRQAAPQVMPALMQGYTAWVNAIEAGGGRGLGGRRVIGAVSPQSLIGLAAAGVMLESAGISIEQREVTHLFASDRKGAKAEPRAEVYALPERLAKPDAVLYDARSGAEALLYVWRRPDGKYIRVAVRPDFKLKGDACTNAVRSGQVVDGRDLNGATIKLLEGGLRSPGGTPSWSVPGTPA